MKQDLEKAKNAYLSSFTSKKSKTLPGATAAAHGNPNGKNDYQKKSGRKPSVLHLKPFGCLAYAGVPKQIRKKFDMRAKMGIMMGYAQRTKGYRIWLIDENKLVETINSKNSLTSRLVSKTSTETPSTSEKPDVSSDNHSLIPCTEVKWIRNIEAWRVVGRLGGQTQAEVAQAIGVSQSVISRIWNRFLETGSAGRKPG
ncbi:retrovirus-related Pol polyprotein from transposon TNT 1-94 [Trichonephila clavipes]|nr:retrovirus-related Pol polyprotein from transposon TNT 1-94 [Trichonephila clavipes]